MVDHGDGKKSDTYGSPGSRHHVNQGLKQQQKVRIRDQELENLTTREIKDNTKLGYKNMERRTRQ